MKEMPRVSAIIIFLNEARFIAEAIESIRSQAYEHWELLLVDDGSTDASADIAKAYAAREPQRIRYVEHPEHANKGMSAARNLGLAHARGEYVAFLDADDIWMPDKLSEQLAILDAHPQVDMVYGRTLLWHSWRGAEHVDRDEYCDLGMPADTIVNPPVLLVSLIENRAQSPTVCNAIMRRDAIARVGGFEAAFPGMFEDQVFFMKLSVTARVFVASRTWAHYRQRDDSCSARAETFGQVRAARRRQLQWLERYLRSQNVVWPQVWRMLRRQQRIARWPALQALYTRYDGLRRVLDFDAATR
jgi:glycosyltransferase involved in cell wall biosynthesis